MLTRNLPKFIVTSFSFLLIACSSTRTLMHENETQSGHNKLYSYPEKFPMQSLTSSQQRIIFASINDLQAKLNPKLEKGIKVGGKDLLKRYLEILKEQYPNEVMVVDAGNFTHPSLDPAQVIDFYNSIDLDVAGLGYNELNLDHRKLKYPFILTGSLSKAKFKALNANLYDLEASKRTNWRHTNNTAIFKQGKLKIGFTSVIGREKALGFTDKMNGFYAKDIAQTIVSEATWLDKKGADLIVVLAHTDGTCDKNKTLPKGKYNFDPSDDSSCDKDSEIFKAYKLIPKNLVDIVFLSGSESKVANAIDDIATVQNFGDGEYISVTEVIFDRESKKLEGIYLHQPVRLCESFLKDNQDCFVENGDNLEIVPAKFLNSNIIHNKESH